MLKLDIEGDGAVRRVAFLELSACEEQRQFFLFAEGGDVQPWTMDLVVDQAIGFR